MNGSYTLGPETATLTVKTGKTGAAAKAGHNLVIDVTAWDATLLLGESPSITLTADSRSLVVRDGHGGMQALGDEDKDNIRQTIDADVLKGTDIAFRSTSIEPGADGTLAVAGELELRGAVKPLTFTLTLGDGGALHGSAIVKQSDWGIKPYSALFGTLKVVDEVEIVVDATLGAAG